MRKKVMRRAVVLALGALAALPSAVVAFTTSGGYVAHNYATAFPSRNQVGPIGVAFDQSDNLYVADHFDGNLYRFEPGGGAASGATRVTAKPIAGGVEGLAVTSAGRLYLARSGAGDVVELDPATGQVVRVVASGIRCATGLAVDPSTGDLFVSESVCGNTIWQISGYETGRGTASPYVTGLNDVDGLAADRTGTLYAAEGGWLLKIDRRAGLPPAVARIAFVPRIDGLALAAHPSSSGPPFVVANRNDGIATLVDFRHGLTATDIFRGGSRGDFAAVDSHGCLYLTQTSAIVKVSGPAGCSFEPTTPAGRVPGAGILLDTLSGPFSRNGRACSARRRIVFRLRQAGGVRLRSAVVYLNGRRVRRLRGRAVTAPIVLTRLPSGRITLKVVALTTRGKRLTTRHLYANCSPPPRCVRSVSLKVPQRRGASAISAIVYVNGRRIKTVRTGRITRVRLGSLPAGQLKLKLVTRYSNATQSITRRSLTGCRKK